jgi:hypothetical protein
MEMILKFFSNNKFFPENGNRIFLRNITDRLSGHAASHPVYQFSVHSSTSPSATSEQVIWQFVIEHRVNWVINEKHCTFSQKRKHSSQTCVYVSVSASTKEIAQIITKYNVQTPCLLTYLLTYLLLIYLLTPWSRALLEKLTAFQLVKKVPACYGTPMFITAFTRALRICPYPERHRSSPSSTSHFLKIHLNINLPSKPRSSK